MKKTIFLFVFIVSIILFLASFYLDILLFKIGALHLSLLSLSLFFLYEEDLKSFLTNVGIPGRVLTNVIYIVAGLIAVFLTLLFMTVVFNLLGLNDHGKVVDIANDLPWYALVLAILFAPVSEELFFRAFLSSRYGILLSSIIFSLFHFSYESVVELVGAFLIGIILAVVFKRSGSIIPPIMIHLITNLVSISAMRGII